MSKDYRYHREEWDSVEDEEQAGKKGVARKITSKSKPKRDIQRREKQRRLHTETY